ncbi:MAG: riboflavin biosynthesis protein RibD [Rhodospirillales bacterium RIFCSPLOWO2_12_FULL_58_28]|nr:MAG: riboflavin biosynthesis protein RibD [Rhodospirillales bacterium RIFCSPLOWO2_02_FULL_58_16]OHC79103.1 MAG: riboflavin biosynthesis protein RibD [Rhodospirillales bacterium RIFCSPLOWO2_12_FULL_58_28]
MRAALALARRGLGNAWPNPAVGCVLVREDLQGMVVGRGWTRPGGRPHAEAEALRRAGDKARGAAAYVSLEPCDHHGQTPPCSQALIDAGIVRAVIAIEDPDPRVSGKGIARLRAAGVKVVEGVLEDEARQANLGFILKITKQRPLFALKLATDGVGRIPAPGDAEKGITGSLARQRGHLLRACHDGVLFGVGTVLDDDPEYTCRLPGMSEHSPVRVLLDPQLRLPVNAKLLQTLDKAPLWVIVGTKPAINRDIYPDSKNLEFIVAGEVDENDRPTPRWVAGELARRGLTRILIEAGPKVTAAFLRDDLVDRIFWFKTKQPLKDAGVAAFDALTAARQFVKTAVHDLGDDILEIYQRTG